MTIASEITALQNNLTAAKNAVTAKGGTVGDTGLAGLADEIDSIPSGGGGEDWGTVTFKTNDMAEPKTVSIQDADEYVSLCVYNSSHEIGGESFWNSDILSVSLGESAVFAPDSFLRGSYKMTTLSGVGSLRSIGSEFLYACQAVNSALDFTNLHSMGTNFMFGCFGFNSNISLGEITIIPSNFMSGCTAFAKTLTVPATVTTVDTNFMYNCDNVTSLIVNAPSANSGLKTSNNTLATQTSTAPMYATGITLTGAQATRWKNRFADRTSSPYRKLILGT